MNAVFQPVGECPCMDPACLLVGTKLTKDGHLVGCNCISHRNKRNPRKGRASEARAWKHMGGQGQTRNDNSPHRWDLSIQMENKAGAQIPKKFLAFVGSKWTKDALFQASKKTPIGEDSYPAIRLELAPSRAYLLVDISPRKP